MKAMRIRRNGEMIEVINADEHVAMKMPALEAVTDTVKLALCVANIALRDCRPRQIGAPPGPRPQFVPPQWRDEVLEAARDLLCSLQATETEENFYDRLDASLKDNSALRELNAELMEQVRSGNAPWMAAFRLPDEPAP